MQAMTKEQWLARPHHHAGDGRVLGRKVFCDGEEFEDVLEANTEQGWLKHMCRGASGSFLIDRKRGEIITKTVRGKIEIVYPK